MTTAPAARSRHASGTNRTPKRPLRSPLAVDGDLAPSHAAGVPGEDAIPHQGAVLSDRAATLADFEDYLRTANSREGRPFGEATINAYVSPGKNLDAWLTANGIQNTSFSIALPCLTVCECAM